MNRAEAYEAVEQLSDWSGWISFSEAVASAPRSPGVYLLRLPETQQVVYVGTAGERTGGGRVGQGLRGRLSIYGRGRGAVSGFGEAALDRALADADWLEQQLSSLRTDGPKRTKVWAQEAIESLAPEVRWTERASKTDALLLERRVEDLLGPHGLWNQVLDDVTKERRNDSGTGSWADFSRHSIHATGFSASVSFEVKKANRKQTSNAQH
jgi:hypothetical protein